MYRIGFSIFTCHVWLSEGNPELIEEGHRLFSEKIAILRESPQLTVKVYHCPWMNGSLWDVLRPFDKQRGTLWINMGQNLLVSILMGWTSIYQLFWCSPGVQGFDTLPYVLFHFLSSHQPSQSHSPTLHQALPCHGTPRRSGLQAPGASTCSREKGPTNLSGSEWITLIFHPQPG